MVNLSRKVSLNKLNKQMVIKIANPGDKITHGEVCNKERSLLIIKPHSAVGGVALILKGKTSKFHNHSTNI